MKKKYTLFSLLLALFLNAQTVMPDNSFGNSGIVTLSNESNGNSIIKSLIQPDGKIIVSGVRLNTNNQEETFLARLNSNGTIDTDYGNAGYCTENQISDGYYSSLYLVDNSLIVFYPIQGKLIKIKSGGTADTTYGNNGIIDLNSSYANKNVLISNQILALKNNGSEVKLDKIDINTGAIISSNTINNITNSTGIFRGPNNKLLVRTLDTNNFRVLLTLINTDGNIDTNFGENGTLVVKTLTSTVDLENNFDFVTIDESNNIIYADSDDGNFTSEIKKFSSIGILDTSFASNGILELNNYSFTDLQVFENKIYFSGAKGLDGGVYNLTIGRLHLDGTFDSTFNNNGVFVYDSNSLNEWAENLNIISSNSMIVAGEYFSGNNFKTYVGKFNVTPSGLYTLETVKNDSLWVNNPLKSTFIYKSSELINTIELYASDGKLVKVISENNTNISHLPSGIFFAKVIFKNGKTVTKKLIKL